MRVCERVGWKEWRAKNKSGVEGVVFDGFRE